MNLPKRLRARMSSGFTLLELLVAIGIVSILLAILSPAVQAVRESSRRSLCSDHLRQIGLALANYHSVYNRLPAGCIQSPQMIDNARNEPRMTWSFAILPMMEHADLYASYDPRQLSTSMKNRDACKTSLAVYQCPSDGDVQIDFEPLLHARYSRGNYAANYGSGSWGKKFWDQSKYRGVMGQNTQMNFSSISDGTSHTVAVAELRAVGDFSDCRGAWAFAAPGASLVGLDCDQECQGINGKPSSDWIPYCSGTPGSLPCNFQNDERSNAGPRSLHEGGAMLLFCDGSVRFISEQINLDVLVAQFTSMNSETIQE